MAATKEKVSELVFIQSKLKAPKNQENKFGGYKYRSCEDILEAVKPLLAEVNCSLTISDDIMQVGDRIYVKATATLYTPTQTFVNTAFAREPLQKKGQDESQVTGAASSYARKYALNGLFCIDDTKDADALNTNKEYTQSAEANQDSLQEAFEIVKPEILTAPSKQHLMNLYNANPALHNYKPFMEAMTKRQKEVA